MPARFSPPQFRAAALVALLAVSVLAAEKQPVTLASLSEAARGTAGVTEPERVWHPRGGAFVYIAGAKVMQWTLATMEARELFSFEAAEKLAVEPVQEHAYAWENRRVHEQRLQYSADGAKLLLRLRGDLFVWDSATGKIEQLTATAEPERDPKFSPDGTKVSFRRGYDLYVIDVATKQETRLTRDGTVTRFNAMLDWVYPEELDLGTAHWWAPDSKSIAYMQFDVSREHVYGHVDAVPVEAVSEPQRYPKAGTPNADVRVGVVPVAGGETRWLDLGEPRAYLYARVGWANDGRNVVVQRLTRVQDRLDILYADPSTGQARVFATEGDKHWVNLRDDLHMLGDGSVLTTSERGVERHFFFLPAFWIHAGRGGFRHIERLAADGASSARVTSGSWEATAIACVSEARKRIWYVSSETSPTERQLYRINFDGSGKQRISAGAGTHAISMSPACDLYFDTFSSIDTPPATTLHDADGKPLQVLREAQRTPLEKYDILKPELLTFKGSGGTLFYAKLIRPAHFDPAKKYPVLVQVYGGPGAQSVVNRWSGLTLEQVFAHKGYVIWQMDNRGSTGRGHAFEAPIYRRLGKIEVEDQVEGVKYLLSLGFADPARIGVMGWSYGGYMTLECLLQAPGVFKAGAAGAPVTNWLNYDSIYTERYLGLPADNADGYRESSPVHSAAKLEGRLLLIHNIEDDNVLFANSLQMQVALQEAGKSYDLLIYPQKTHGVSGAARAHLNAQYVRFFDEALK